MPQNLAEYEALARAALDDVAFDYFTSGAEDQFTRRENRAAYTRLKLLPHVLVDVSQRDTQVGLLGGRLAHPVIIAPMAFQRLAHPDGEVGVAQAAQACDLAMTLSTYATTALEDLADQVDIPLFYQLYFINRESAEDMVARAEQAGYRAIFLTVDMATFGKREAHRRSGPVPEVDVPNLSHTQLFQRWRQDHPGASVQTFVQSIEHEALDWASVEWLRTQTRLPIVLKGVLRPDDARRAVDHGAAGTRRLESRGPPVGHGPGYD